MVEEEMQLVDAWNRPFAQERPPCQTSSPRIASCQPMNTRDVFIENIARLCLPQYTLPIASDVGAEEAESGARSGVLVNLNVAESKALVTLNSEIFLNAINAQDSAS